MTEIFLIGLGGAIGAILRHLTGKVSMRFFGVTNIYTGTLFANLIGCLFAGILLAFFTHTETIIEDTRLFLTIGILGSYTTFSTFAFETQRLFDKPLKDLLLYLFYQIAGAFIVLIAGYGMTVWLMRALNNV